jgi:hypothetical protein
MYRVIYPKDRRGFEANFSDSKSVPKPANLLLRTTIETSMSLDNKLISEMIENRSDTHPKNSGHFLKVLLKNMLPLCAA